MSSINYYTLEATSTDQTEAPFESVLTHQEKVFILYQELRSDIIRLENRRSANESLLAS